MKTRRRAGIIFAIFTSSPFVDSQNFQNPLVGIKRHALGLRVELEIERLFAFGDSDDFAPSRAAGLELDVERHAKDGRRLFLRDAQLQLFRRLVPPPGRVVDWMARLEDPLLEEPVERPPVA